MAASVIDESVTVKTNNGDLIGATANSASDTIEELTKEVELLKQKLEEERAKFNDVECNLELLLK